MSKLKAYKISCGDDEHGQEVLFAERSKDLKGCRPGHSCDCEYIELRARRAPEFDQHSPGPITVRQYLEHGWWWLCEHCERQISGDSEAIIFDLIPPTYVFCSRECIQKSLDSWAKTKPEEMHESAILFVSTLREYLALPIDGESNMSIS